MAKTIFQKKGNELKSGLEELGFECDDSDWDKEAE